jgi:LysM repeat protein
MKMPKLLHRKKLRATTARRLAVPEMDYEEMSEPNMKLSRALLIVLVLHVVAVAGIVAFNTIKTRQGSMAPVAAAPAVNKVAPASAEVPKSDAAKPAPALSKTAAKTDHPKKNEPGLTADSGKTYVVARGDNPVTIARKLKVSQDDLLSLNHIDDPRKLQIGQKLLVPKTKAKRSE